MHKLTSPLLLALPALIALLALAGLPRAEAAGSSRKLEQAQVVFSSAMRWSDYEAAWQMVDPEVRAAKPLTDLELERYKQLQYLAEMPVFDAPAAAGEAAHGDDPAFCAAASTAEHARPGNGDPCDEGRSGK